MELIDAPTYSRIRVTSLGSTEGIEGIEAAVGDRVLLWTRSVKDENPFVPVRIRGVVDDQAHLSWLPDDAEVEVLEQTRYAGMPEDLVPQARPMPRPAGTHGLMQTADGWHDLIWRNDDLHSALVGWTDTQIAIEEILCALTFAPDDGDLRPMLFAGLKALHSQLTRDPRTYPPADYPWKRGRVPDDLGYFTGR